VGGNCLIPLLSKLRQASAIGQAAFAVVEEIAASLIAVTHKAVRRIEIGRCNFACAAYADTATASQEITEGKSYARPETSRFILWVDLKIKAVDGKRRAWAFIFRGRAYR
jgi:hypothetical protein